MTNKNLQIHIQRLKIFTTKSCLCVLSKLNTPNFTISWRNFYEGYKPEKNKQNNFCITLETISGGDDRDGGLSVLEDHGAAGYSQPTQASQVHEIRVHASRLPYHRVVTSYRNKAYRTKMH